MSNFLKDPVSTFLFIIKHWSTILIISGIVTGSARYLMGSLHKEMMQMKMNVKRLELIRAIDHNYSIEVICQIYDEYVALGGNSYAQKLFEQYKEKKENEEKNA